MKVSKKDNKKNVFAVGALSFFGGIGQDMFLPILPLYLTTVLGFNKEFIGLSEGLVSGLASIFKIVSGYLSDNLKSRKSIIFAGYLLSMIGRFLLVITASSAAVLALRAADGVGKGVKDAAKDTLISSSTERKNRGRGFGIVRALDTFGSVAGPLILFGLLYFFKDNPLKYHYILLFTTLPLLVTLLIVIFKVKEVPSKVELKGDVSSQKLPKKFYYFLIIIALFTLGNSSDAFLILRAENIGIQILSIPLIIALFNFFYASASIPLGSLSDRIGREKVILLGWSAYALAYIGFGLANATYQVWLLYMLYGVYYATTEGVIKALVADTVSSAHRGKAYGALNATVGILAIPANVMAGYLWERYSPAAPFYFGALMALLACMLLWSVMQKNNPKLDFKAS